MVNLDPELPAENLARIAASVELSQDLLEALRAHPHAWAGLVAWVDYVQATGHKPPVPSIDDVPVAREKDRPGPKKTRRVSPRVALGLVGMLVVGAGVGVVVGGGLHSDASVPATQPTVEAKKVEASGNGFACMAQGSQVTCVGQGDRGQLGTGAASEAHLHTFTLDHEVDQLVAGGDHACALSGQEVICWGDNRWKQVADSAVIIMPPTPLPYFTGKTVVQISAGEIHTCALSEGQVACWGSDYSGQLGSGTQGQAAQGITLVDVPAASSMVASRFGTCVTSADGQLCWGSNHDHCIANDDAPILPPTLVEEEQ